MTNGITVFNGEKTNLFWTGLIILGFSVLVVFTAIWQIGVSYANYLSYSGQYNSTYAYSFVWSLFPIIVGGIIFALIGSYMMKSGVKKPQTPIAPS